MASHMLRKLAEAAETAEKPEKMMSVETANGEASLLLLGAVASIMVLYYLVNAKKEIRKETWTMINLAVSIFLAVLSYNCVNHLCCILFSFPMELEGKPETLDIVVKGIQLFCWWVFVLLLLFINRSSTLKLQSHGTIGGHILGFAAIYFFGYIALTDSFADAQNKYKTLLVLLILWLSLAILFGFTGVIRKVLASALAEEGEEMDAWHEQSADTGTDFAAMGTSFLIVFFIRFLVLEEVPTVDGELGAGHGKSTTLFILAVVFLLLSAGVTIGHHALKLKGAILDYVTTTISTTSAFMMIFALMWYYGKSAGTELLSMTNVAVTLSLMSVFFILAVVFIKGIVDFPDEKKVFKASFTAVSLAVGLSWEKVFDAAVEGAADLFKTYMGNEASSNSEHLYTVLIEFVLLALVFPAWVLYILPKASDEVQKEYSLALAVGPLPFDAICNDEDYTNDYYEGADGDDDDE